MFQTETWWIDQTGQTTLRSSWKVVITHVEYSKTIWKSNTWNKLVYSCCCNDLQDTSKRAHWNVFYVCKWHSSCWKRKVLRCFVRKQRIMFCSSTENGIKFSILELILNQKRNCLEFTKHGTPLNWESYLMIFDTLNYNHFMQIYFELLIFVLIWHVQ